MNSNQWIISIVVGILLFIIAYYLGQISLIGAIIVSVIGFLSNVLIDWNASRKRN